MRTEVALCLSIVLAACGGGGDASTAAPASLSVQEAIDAMKHPDPFINHDGVPKKQADPFINHDSVATQ